MAVAKKDQERAGYAWMYGAQARKDDQMRVVPEYWLDHADAWLQGFDDIPLPGAGTAKLVTNQMEVDEAGISETPQ